MQPNSTADQEITHSGGVDPSETSLMEQTGIITEIKKFATHDGPGIRTTVFLKGCPLRCTWCANPETQLPYPQLYYMPRRCKEYGGCVSICPEGAISMDTEHKLDRSACTRCMKCVQGCPNGAFRQVGMLTTVADVMKDIEKDIPFYGKEGGMTLSGGEPLFQPAFAIALLKSCRERKISTVLDTCGYAPSDVVEGAMRYTDLVLLDIKHMDSVQHRQATGVDNDLILQNAEIMARMTDVRISLPLIPGFNDSRFNLSETARFVISLGIDHVDINPLHVLGTDKYLCLGLESPYTQMSSIKKHDLSRAKEIFEELGIKVTVGRMM